MAYDVNFSLLGPPVDVAGAVATGYQHGRALRQQQQQDSAFAMLARDPNSAEGRALLTQSGRPDLARQFRQWGREDRREEMFRSAFGGNASPAQPSALPSSATVSPPSAPAAAPSSPSASPPPSLPPLNPDLLRQYYAEDPEGAGQLVETWNRLDATQRAQQTRRFAAAVPILSEVARLPVEQRGAAVRSQRDFLVSNGWTPDQIENYANDPSDLNTRMLLRMGVPIAEQRQFFAPLEGGQGAVYRDSTTLAPIAANPTTPRTEMSYDAQGNQLLATVPGTPAIGPGANLFGAGAQVGNVAPHPMTDEEMRAAERGGVATQSGSADLDNWNRAGRAGPGGPRTFP